MSTFSLDDLTFTPARGVLEGNWEPHSYTGPLTAPCFFRQDGKLVKADVGQYIVKMDSKIVVINSIDGIFRPAPGPTGAPSNLTQDNDPAPTTTTFKIDWTNGDANSRTEVYLDGALVATVAAGVATYTFTGLEADTTYEVSIRHVHFGQYSAFVTDDFATAAS